MKFIVVWFESLWSVHDCVVVEADTEAEAAELGMEYLQQNEQDEIVDHVFVAPWSERVAYKRRLAVERAEFQCCAGRSKYQHDGHYADCPNHAQDDEQPTG